MKDKHPRRDIFTVIDREVRTERYRTLRDKTEHGAHPTREQLYQCVAGSLTGRAALSIRRHISLCRRCAQEVADLMRIEHETGQELLAWAEEETEATDPDLMIPTAPGESGRAVKFSENVCHCEESSTKHPSLAPSRNLGEGWGGVGIASQSLAMTLPSCQNLIALEEIGESRSALKEQLVWLIAETGLALTAATPVATQKKEFTTPLGKIELTCIWGKESDDTLFVRINWNAAPELEDRFEIQLLNPQTHHVLATIPAATIKKGTAKRFNMSALGLNPLKEQLAIALVLLESAP